MKSQLPLIAAVCLAFAGGFTIAPHSSKEGGDSSLSSQEARTTGTDSGSVSPPRSESPDDVRETPLSACRDERLGRGAAERTNSRPSVDDGAENIFPSGVAVEPKCDPVPATPCVSTPCVSLRDAIAAYRRSGGVKYYVSGKTDAQHLVQDHGWTAEQIRGLSVDEQQWLHGATHTGRINPSQFVAATKNAAPFTPTEGRPTDKPQSAADTKPRIRIVSPASWDCRHCPGHRNQDWSGFDVEFVKDDNREKFPCTEWTDSRGVTRRLYGQRKPSQVLWSYRETMR